MDRGSTQSTYPQHHLVIGIFSLLQRGDGRPTKTKVYRSEMLDEGLTISNFPSCGINRKTKAPGKRNSFL